MASNSIVSDVLNASKDMGKKKKRGNRSAKLKQCKLDARREQWLSQVRNKTCKGERGEVFGGKITSPSSVLGYDSSHHFEELDMERQSGGNGYGLIAQNTLSESAANGNVSGGNGCAGSDSSSSTRSCSSSSSFNNGGCCSGNITEEEEEEEEGGGHEDDSLDDWEAVADALAASDNPPQGPSMESTEEKEAVVELDLHCKPVDEGSLVAQVGKPDSEGVELGLRDGGSTRAWRADDASRPRCLPNLLKQNSFPMNSEKHSGRETNPWGINHAISAPTSCPICYEDLDLTDSSFLPCLCGFRLCLFCHRRILEGDGRCPGCRKPYELDTNPKHTIAAGVGTDIRLARSYSMFSRT